MAKDRIVKFCSRVIALEGGRGHVVKVTRSLNFWQICVNMGALKLQELTMQEWTMTEKVAGVDFAGVDIDGESCRGGHCRSGQ